MAGLPWFELDVDMPDDPKCVCLGSRLKNPLAFGYVVRLYAYCYRHGTDAFTGPGAAETVEEAARWKGRAGVLLAALEAEGFIDRGEDSLVVHGVGNRLGPHLAKLERDRVRAQERRDAAEKSLRRPRDVHATTARLSDDVHGDRDRDRDNNQKQQPASGPKPLGIHLEFGVTVPRKALNWGATSALIETIGLEAAVAACTEAAPRSDGYPDRVPLGFLERVLADAAKRRRSAPPKPTLPEPDEAWLASLGPRRAKAEARWAEARNAVMRAAYVDKQAEWLANAIVGLKAEFENPMFDTEAA
jgi:hypothetical protein